MDDEEKILAMTPRRKLDLWKVDEASPDMPIVIVAFGTFIRINRVGAVVWELCTGENSVRAIVDEVARQCPGISWQQIATDVLAFLHALDKKGVLVLDFDPLVG